MKAALLEATAGKIARGDRLSFDDGVALFRHPDWAAVGRLAHADRTRRHGDRVLVTRNMRIEVTNVCVAGCRFCSFSRSRPGDPGAFTMTLEQAWQKLEAAMQDPPNEIHLVSGLNPDLPLSYYEELLRGFRRINPDIALRCFTAVEIHFFSKRTGLDYRDVLARLRAAGLTSLHGGGAEIFHPDVRRRIAPGKATADQYLAVHAAAHRMGLRSNTTMLYGHVETIEHRVDHILRIRAQQDDTGGFDAFVPLAFHPEGNRLCDLAGPTGIDDLRTVAVSRLLLANVDHVKTYWVSATPKIAQIALGFGADDIDGTTVHETIYRSAGSTSPRAMSFQALSKLVVEAGFVPVERNPSRPTTYLRTAADRCARAP
jgi:aminodeoxyfutalosine synthase